MSDEGVSLADVYTAGGEVLMGTMRWEQERLQEFEREQMRAEADRRRVELELAEAEMQARIAVLQRELEARRAEIEVAATVQRMQEAKWVDQRLALIQRRSRTEIRDDEVEKHVGDRPSGLTGGSSRDTTTD